MRVCIAAAREPRLRGGTTPSHLQLQWGLHRGVSGAAEVLHHRRRLVGHRRAALVNLDDQCGARLACGGPLLVQLGEVRLVRRHESRHKIRDLLVGHACLPGGAHGLLRLQPPLVHVLRVVHADDQPAVDPAVPCLLVPPQSRIHRQQVGVNRRHVVVRQWPEATHPALKEDHVQRALHLGPGGLLRAVASPAELGLVVAWHPHGALGAGKLRQRSGAQRHVMRGCVAAVL
mmetsp:Transcript_37058/g.96142  ORF Transcript_37058/g.96142 Transcript_37058/m.96142 type:complete len:231 (+) Transcript_37058:220-912(+)